jgi:hypothetical protein
LLHVIHSDAFKNKNLLLAYRDAQFKWSNFSVMSFNYRLLKIGRLPASSYLLLAACFWLLAFKTEVGRKARPCKSIKMTVVGAEFIPACIKI